MVESTGAVRSTTAPSGTSLKFWFTTWWEALKFLLSWHTNRPSGKAGPRLAFTASIPSVLEQPSTAVPSMMWNSRTNSLLPSRRYTSKASLPCEDAIR